LAIADAGKYPLLDHVPGAMTFSVAQRAGNEYKMKTSTYPFLVEVEQEVFDLER